MWDVFACQEIFPSKNQGRRYGMWIGGGPSGAVVSLTGRLARRVGILRRFPDRTLRHASFCDALRLDVIVPEVLTITIEVIVNHFGLKN